MGTVNGVHLDQVVTLNGSQTLPGTTTFRHLEVMEGLNVSFLCGLLADVSRQYMKSVFLSFVSPTQRLARTVRSPADILMSFYRTQRCVKQTKFARIATSIRLVLMVRYTLQTQ